MMKFKTYFDVNSGQFKKEKSRLENSLKSANDDEREGLYDELDDLIEDFQAQSDAFAHAMA